MQLKVSSRTQLGNIEHKLDIKDKKTIAEIEKLIECIETDRFYTNITKIELNDGRRFRIFITPMVRDQWSKTKIFESHINVVQRFINWFVNLKKSSSNAIKLFRREYKKSSLHDSG